MDIREEAEKISRFLRQDDAKLFLEHVSDRYRKCVSSLRGNSELIEVGRSQGRLEILDWILKLKG